ncbi:unnamed protein product [Periconia digitata]|uniref:Uncharacterized protein n=1 Tax=Periconia digitata TaxID=1303443 RepID=A0A9W4UVU9_9PLEO|nr:unnamed protein product [Periconia digitata]
MYIHTALKQTSPILQFQHVSVDLSQITCPCCFRLIFDIQAHHIDSSRSITLSHR